MTGGAKNFLPQGAGYLSYATVIMFIL